MRAANILSLAAIPLAALAGWIAARSSPQAQAHVPAAAVAAAATAQFDGGGGGDEEGKAAPRIYYPAPLTAEAARTWMKLQQKMGMNFPNDTPLEDVLKSIREATGGKEKGDAPIPIYVDPVGLQEAEKTEQSPVKLNLEGIPLATSLELMLKQLGLTYYVHKDGLLVITSRDSTEIPSEPSALILDRLEALQKEVAALRAAVLRGQPAAAPAAGGSKRGGGLQ